MGYAAFSAEMKRGAAIGERKLARNRVDDDGVMLAPIASARTSIANADPSRRLSWHFAKSRSKRSESCPQQPTGMDRQMSEGEVNNILSCVIDGVQEIDQQCSTRLNGVEHGLVNVKLEFRDRALREVGKRLTEERLIAWLLYRRLNALGWETAWEVWYPANSRKSCDLVVQLEGTARLWLELKMAWKAWFNCVGGPNYSNGWYRSYLGGSNRTHSFRHDLEKLCQTGWSPGDRRAVCLIGCDWAEAPMDEDVLGIVREFCQPGHELMLAAERHWADRRSEEFRLNVWCWLLAGASVS